MAGLITAKYVGLSIAVNACKIWSFIVMKFCAFICTHTDGHTDKIFNMF